MIRAALAVLLFATTLPAQNVLRSGPYVVTSWTSSEKLAQNVVTEATRFRLPGMPADAPAFGEPIHIVLAGNDAQFRAATGNRAPEWGVGVAAPAEGLIVLRAYGGTRGGYDQLYSVLRHELAHIALHRYGAGARAPRWFDEGYATWSAGELGSRGEWQLRIAFAAASAPALDSLELAWPALANEAQIAYLLAGSVVQYLVNQSGERALTLFLREWRAGGSFEAALGSVYGLSVDQLETHWKRDVKRRYGWFAVLVQSAIYVSIISVGVFALYMVRRRRDRLKLLHMQATEPPDEPAYWLEPEPVLPDFPEPTDTKNDAAIDRNASDPDIPKHG